MRWTLWLLVLIVLALISYGFFTLGMYERNRKLGKRTMAAHKNLESRNVYNWEPTEETHPVVAVIIEPRRHRNLKFVIEHLHAVLPQVPIHVFHGMLNRDMIPVEPHITAHELPLENLTLFDYNAITMNPAFYQSLPGKHILVFQTDSVLFSRSPVKLEEFLEYDYVGAPHHSLWYSFLEWKPQRFFEVGNGGLSLRRRSMMLRCLEKVPIEKAKYFHEDIYFVHQVVSQGGKIPKPEKASRFAFQHLYTDVLPFGCHKYLPEKWLELITAEEQKVFAKQPPIPPNP